MKHIKAYKIFENLSDLDLETVKDICQDLSDCGANIDLSHWRITDADPFGDTGERSKKTGDKDIISWQLIITNLDDCKWTDINDAIIRLKDCYPIESSFESPDYKSIGILFHYKYKSTSPYVYAVNNYPGKIMDAYYNNIEIVNDHMMRIGSVSPRHKNGSKISGGEYIMQKFTTDDIDIKEIIIYFK
jgi:hypothetical protein